MVDPNRKINRFTDRDIVFLEECEQEFSTRYGEEDAEFMEHCAQPLADPPILENFSLSGTGNMGGSGGQPYHYHRKGNQHHRSWRGNADSGRHGGHNNYRHRRGGRGGGRSHGDHRDRDHRAESYPTNRPPMNIRRDYSNFVAASKE